MSEEAEIETPEIKEEVPIGAVDEGADEQEALDDDARATLQGWTNLEKWIEDGNDPALHRTSTQFLADGKEHNGRLRSRVKTMENKLNQERKARLRQEKFREQNLDIIKEDANRRAEERLQKAIDEMDEPGIRAAISDKEKVTQIAPPQDDGADAIAEFSARNAWYGKDAALTSMAQGLSGTVASEMPHLSPAENLEEVESRMAPYLNKPAPRPPGLGGGRKRGPVVKTGFNSLDAEHKANFSDMCRQKFFTNDDAGKQNYYVSVMKRENKMAARGQ